MKFSRYNPFFHEEPPEFDVKLPAGKRGFNRPFLFGLIFGVAFWCAVYLLVQSYFGGH